MSREPGRICAAPRSWGSESSSVCHVGSPELREGGFSEIVAGLSGERALWMWYIYDEPSQATLGVEQASRVYNLMRRLDPNRPSIMLVNRVPEMLVYHPFCDVLWYDRYPIIATTEALSSLSPIAAALQKTRQSVGLRKPVWPVLQVHDNKGSPSLRSRRPGLPAPDDENHRPNEAEIRAQAHLAIALDSMGVVYYWAPQSWYSMESDTPKVWNTLSRVVRELQGLEPVLLSTETPPAVTATGDNKVLLWKRRHDGRIYVGLINTSLHAAQPVTLACRSRMARAGCCSATDVRNSVRKRFSSSCRLPVSLSSSPSCRELPVGVRGHPNAR